MNSLRVDARRSKYDGLWRRWELFDAVTLGEVTPAMIKEGGYINWRQWICTGVFQTRRSALA